MGEGNYCCGSTALMFALEMGRRRCSAKCSARQRDYSAEVRPNFDKHSALFVASHLRRFCARRWR